MKIKTLVLGLTAAASLAVFGGEKIIKNGDTLVFAGDSITKFGNESEQGYVRLVVRGLAANGINVTYYGKGHSGWMASEIRGNFQEDVIDNHPQVCTIFAGVNDCGHGGWTKETGGSSTPDDVAAMADMAIQAGIKPVLLSPTGVKGEDFKQNIYDYATEVKSIAQTRNVPYAATYEAYRAYIDDPANPRFNDQYKAASDGTHMSPVGNRIIAREVLKAFGFDSTEMAKAEAAWNVVPGITSLHPSVKITDGEYKAMKVAAEKAGKSLGAYHTDLFARGVELMKQNPGKVSATSGAAKQCSVSVPITYAQLDGMIEVGRAITDHDRIPAIANYAMLAAVHELPAVTDAELPTEPLAEVTPSDFGKQVEFTVSGYTGSSTLVDFPVAVRLSAGSPEGFAYSDMANSANGDELRFADGDGRSLAYEIESWNPQGESLVWVKLPSLAQGTVFTMYYGGEPTDTVPSDWAWRASDYIGVWHMTEDGGTAFDSVNGLDAEPLGASASKMQKRTAGVFGQARVNSSKVDAYGGQSMLCVSDSTLLDFDGTFTFSGWVRMTETANDDLSRIVSRNLGSNYAPQWELRISGFDTLNAYSDSNTPVSGAIPSARNAWVHIAGVFNGSTFTAYANGAKVFEQTISPSPNSDYRLMFGAKDDSLVTGHLVGDYDEFRLRDAVSSADWVKAEYDQSKTTFLSAGEATDVTGGQAHTHVWGTPSYSWSTDYKTCTGTSVCTGNAAHKKTLAVSSVYSIVEDSTTEAEGTGCWTATFTQSPFSTQTQNVVIPKKSAEPSEDDPPHVDPAGSLNASGDTTGATDTSAIQTLIDAAAKGGTVTLASGTFYLDSQLMVSNGVTLAGQGWTKTIIKAASAGFRGAAIEGGAKLEFVTVTGFKSTDNWTHGGGVQITDGSVSWCCISNNVLSARNCYGGGIGFPADGKGSVDHSIIAFNQAGTHTSGGGGISLYNTPYVIDIDTCLVYGNTTSVSDANGNGGGIAVVLNNPTVTIRNTTIADNTSTGRAGGFSSDSFNANKVTLVNCIVSGNTAATDANVCSTVGSGWSNNLIDVDARFTNAAAHDYTLTSSSPAKGAGATYSGIGKDLANGDFANPPSMGCYEYDGSLPPPDDPQNDDPTEEEEEADEDWIRESAMTFGSTGAWTGDKAVVEAGGISVSNATFTAARPAPHPAVVTITTTFDFGSAVVKPFDTAKSAGIGVVKAGGENRYAMLTAGGVVTNGTVVANIASAANVSVTLDDAAHTVSYAVDGVTLGTYSMVARQKGVSTVRYAGKTSVSALNGAYRTVKDPGGDTPLDGSGVQFFVD